METKANRTTYNSNGPDIIRFRTMEEYEQYMDEWEPPQTVEYIRYTFDCYYSWEGTINMTLAQQDAIEEEWEREAHEMNATR